LACRLETNLPLGDPTEVEKISDAFVIDALE
jgi:hypothetical protein